MLYPLSYGGEQDDVVDVVGAVGNGTTARWGLPPVEALPGVTRVRAEAARRSMVKVLVIDDDPAIVHLLELNLELDGHDVVAAADGPAGLQLLGSAHPDVVVLDLMLPGMDGFEVCRRITSDPATADIPVVLLSARANPADVPRGQEVGAADHVVKPFDPLGFTDRLRSLVEAARGDAGGA